MKRLLMLIVAMVLLSGAAWGQKLKADDPTAWKYPTVIVPDVKNEKPPWGDSRYRLERNEVTNQCRVTEFRDGRWKPAHGRDLFGRSCKDAEINLEEYRESERIDKAWRPIK